MTAAFPFGIFEEFLNDTQTISFFRSEMLHCQFLWSKKSNGSFWNSSSQNSDQKSRWLHNQYEIAYFGSRRGNVLYVLSAHNFAKMVKNLASTFFCCGIIFFAFVTYQLFLDYGRVSNFVLIMTWKHVRTYFFHNYGVKAFLKDQFECTVAYFSCM